MKITDQEVHILLHSLGLDDNGRGRIYRNYFATGEGSKDWDSCKRLCELKLMRDNGANDWCAGMHFFSVTEKGKSIINSRSK